MFSDYNTIKRVGCLLLVPCQLLHFFKEKTTNKLMNLQSSAVTNKVSVTLVGSIQSNTASKSDLLTTEFLHKKQENTVEWLNWHFEIAISDFRCSNTLWLPSFQNNREGVSLFWCKKTKERQNANACDPMRGESVREQNGETVDVIKTHPSQLQQKT